MKKCLFNLIFFLLLSAFFAPLYAADPPLPTPVGRVVWIKGELRAMMPNQEERILKKTSLIYLRDKLMTNEMSEAQVVFTDQTLMTFGNNTQFYIEQYQYQPQSKAKSVGKYIVNLITGGFRTITGLIAKENPNQYQVNTPVATIGVRGTDYAVYLKDNQLDMQYYSGSPCITSGSTLCLNADHPYARVPEKGVAPVSLKQQPEVFKKKLEVTPATIEPFKGGGGSQTPSSGGGTVSSFCIQ